MVVPGRYRISLRKWVSGTNEHRLATYGALLRSARGGHSARGLPFRACDDDGIRPIMARLTDDSPCVS